MNMVSKRSFQVPARRLWEIVGDPGNQPAWNPKCVHADTIGPPWVGAKFAVTYDWKGKLQEAVGEVIDIQPEREIVFRYHYQDESLGGSVDERFTLMEEGGGTTLIHTVDYRKSGLPKWLLLLIGFINRFGKVKGPDPLQGLDDLLK